MSDRDDHDDRVFDQWLPVLIKKPWKAHTLDALLPGEPELAQRLREALAAARPDHPRPAITGRPRKAAPGEPERPPRDAVVSCRVDASELAVIDLLVEAGVRPTRSDAAAWFIRQGIEANTALVDEVRGMVDEIRRLREQAQRRVNERDGAPRTPPPDAGTGDTGGAAGEDDQ